MQGALRVVARDSVTGEPVRRLRISVPAGRRAARGTWDGVAVLDSVPAGAHTLRVACMAFPGHALDLASVPVAVRAGATTTITVEVAATGVAPPGEATLGCDQKPYRTVVGEFRGEFEGGAEHNRFIPCRRGSGVPAGHPVLAGGAAPWVWVQLVGAAAGPHLEWPPGRELPNGHTRLYVHWHGTLEGPDRYGHFGMAEYELRVDRVLAVARAAPRGCGAGTAG
jgi:hypothetical protein